MKILFLCGLLLLPSVCSVADDSAFVYDVRSLIAYDQLRSEGWSREAAAAVFFDATTAESLLDAVKLEAAKPRGK